MTTLTQYTADDTIIGDRGTYTAFVSSMNADLQPLGMLEVTFAAEVVRALWRLRSLPTDVMQLEEAARASLARVRSGIQTTIRWAMTELRRIQTARALRSRVEVPPGTGIADPNEITKVLKREQSAARPAADNARRPMRPDPQQVKRLEAEIDAMLARVPRRAPDGDKSWVQQTDANRTAAAATVAGPA